MKTMIYIPDGIVYNLWIICGYYYICSTLLCIIIHIAWVMYILVIGIGIMLCYLLY